MKKLIRVLTIIFTGLFFLGCTTNKKIDWSNRVGTYSYDQAVLEFGPPDKSARLSDGTTIAEWYQAKGSRFSFGVGTGVGVGPVGVGVGVPLGGNKVKVLRLTFAPDGILQANSNTVERGDKLDEAAGSTNQFDESE